MSYKAKKKRADPYTKIVEGPPEMRQDIVDLVKKTVGEQSQACVLEQPQRRECPLTIQALRNALQAAET